MEILIIRHGEAVDDAGGGLGDGARYLTGKGRKVTRQVASWLAERDERRPVELWTSPLVRAVQTAEIVAEAAGLVDEVLVDGALATGGDPREVLKQLLAYRDAGPLCLVGHEPGLSALASTLLEEPRWPGFKKSGVLALSWAGRGPATFRFALLPKDMAVVRELSKLTG